MGKNFLKRAAWFTLGGVLALANVAKAEDRPADKILAEIKAIQPPARPADLATNDAAQTAFREATRASTEKKAELIGELLKASPEHPELAKLLPTRWGTLAMKAECLPTLKAETEAVIARSHDEHLVGAAYLNRAAGVIRTASPETKLDDLIAEFRIFADKYPANRSIHFLASLIVMREKETKAKIAIYRRFESEFPGTATARQAADSRTLLEGSIARADRVGKPFTLEFTDAIKETPVSMAALKGKVVVVDFWATWCGPCIAEMPAMKKLYAEYKDKGVQFIGISLDQPEKAGGLDKLKDYVAKNGIEWPQYYQGNGWYSEFSMSWGINSIPSMFLVDAEGILVSVEARGKLESLIPEYLEKAKAKKVVSRP